MDVSLDELFLMVFRRVIRDDLEKFSHDSRMLVVLMELDGKKNMAVISENMGMKMSAMREVISKLLLLKLIEPVDRAIPILDKEFFNYLNIQLTLAIGPIAGILIEDAVADLGHSISRFPRNRAAELVNMLAKQIQREDKGTHFKQNMVVKIREQG